jgi:nucleotide-binding universal stress UspA family protein
MTAHNTVLVPLDGSAHPTAAIPVARGLAKLLHATVAVLHVSDDALAPTALVERMKLSPEDVHGLAVERRPGPAAAVIVQQAAERHAAMIVMCPQIQTDLRSRALGSVAEAVLRTARCPIVLVPWVRGRNDWALRQLLIPHDGTPTSAAAMGPATDLASLAGAELIVLHVATPGAEHPTEPGTLVFPRYIDHAHHEWPAWGREFLDRLRAVGGARDGMKMRLAVAQGDAGDGHREFPGAERPHCSGLARCAGPTVREQCAASSVTPLVQ